MKSLNSFSFFLSKKNIKFEKNILKVKKKPLFSLQTKKNI